ncbi:MAG: KOW domain-containing RNA-binding protein [Syntrophomonadaceae bacterium]|nr:KOW domain-containing RNA-binding protein [Syntrophomonadaceae bacterium]
MENYLGRIVYSRKGRDRGKAMIVLEMVNEQYVLVADGELRRVENPKLKNLKHLKISDLTDEETVQVLKTGAYPGNHIIRRNLKELSADHATSGKEV